MIPQSLSACERTLRRAVERRQYDDLPRQFAILRKAIEGEIACLADGSPLRVEIAGWTLATLKWVRLMIATHRSALAAELVRLPRVGRYLSFEGCSKKRILLDL
jgi:hypothetical protein